MQRNSEPEGAASTGGAVDPEFSVQQFDQTATDDQSQAAATMLAGERRVALFERKEQALLRCCADAGTGIAD